METETKKDIQIAITNGAASLLAQALSIPEWTTDAGEKYRAGQLIEDDLIFVSARPMISESAFNEWAKTTVLVTLTQRKKDVAKKCIAGVVARLPAGKHLNSLLDALGLAPE